jgi:uncharacterized integral membrane protein
MPDYSARAATGMQILRTLIWVVVAALLAILASNNWTDVTLNLWGSLQADVKLPLLLLIVWGIGFVPTTLIARGRLWRVKRKMLLQQQLAAVAVPPTGTSYISEQHPEGGA